MIPEKSWVIINVRGAIDQFGYLLEADQPRLLYENYEVAVDSLLAMQKQSPDDTYVLFAATEFARKSDADDTVYFVEPVE